MLPACLFASEYSYNKNFFKQFIYTCKLGAMDGRKSNFILTFLLKWYLEYQIYQVQYLQSHKAGFRGYKIMN